MEWEHCFLVLCISNLFGDCILYPCIVMSCNFAFFGTSQFAVDVLDQMRERGYTPTLIVTTPDKPAGRGNQLTPPPVKSWAEEHGIDYLQPETLDADTVGELANTEWDVFVVAAYGKILPAELLAVPAVGTLNIHPSLLPKLRGPSPIQSAILYDQSDHVGVTVMQIDSEMDHGPIVAQARIEIGEDDWPPAYKTLADMLATEGADLLADALPQWVAGEIAPEAQEHEQATYTRKITKADGDLDAIDDPRRKLCTVRALSPAPAAYMHETCGDETVRLKVIEAQLDEDGNFEPSVVVPAGKREMSYDEFRRGCR